LDGSRAALPAPVERIRAVVSRVKQEGGRAALFCVCCHKARWSESSGGENCLEQVWRPASDEMRRDGQQALGHMRKDFDTP
jgi:hypothetical protein